MEKQFYIYILASASRVLYIGVTNNLIKRLWKHRNGEGSTFVQRYRVIHLVHFEIYGDAYTAITREKELKTWRRSKKIDLIEQRNPNWIDLSIELGLPPEPLALPGR